MPRKPTPSKTSRSPGAFWAGLLLLAATTLLLWAPGQRGFFALDDFVFLEAYAPGAHRSQPSLWPTAVSPVDNAYRPLTTAAYFSLARRAFGLEPSGYHLASLSLHLLTTLLVAGFCWSLTGDAAASLLGGLFYGSRSSLWVAVRWTSGVQDLGLALGSALAALGLVVYVRRRRTWGLAACLAGVVLALGSKEAALVLVVALLPVAAAARPGRWVRRGVLALGPALVLTGLYLLWRVVLTWSHPTIHSLSTSADHVAPRLARFVLWSFSGAAPPPETSGLPAAAALALAGLGLFALARRSARYRRPGQPPAAWVRSLAGGAAFYLVALLPPLVITQEAHQYYLAMPLVGLSLAVAGAAAGLLEAAEARSPLLVAALVVALAGGGLATSFWEVRAKDSGRIASGGFYKLSDGEAYERAWRGVSGLWPSFPRGANLLLVGYPYDGIISADLDGRGLKPTSTMASMFRAFYGRADLAVARVFKGARGAGALRPAEALERLEAEPDKTFVGLWSNERFEALSGPEARKLLRKMMEEAARREEELISHRGVRQTRRPPYGIFGIR